MAKINITMPDELLNSLDYYAEKTCMTRSGFVSQAVRCYIDSMKFSNMLDELTAAVRRLGNEAEDNSEAISEVQKMLACLSVLQHNEKQK